MSTLASPVAHRGTDPVTTDPARRRVPALGGFSPTLLRLELRRLVRNRRTVMFTLVFPAAMLLIVSGTDTTWSTRVGAGNEAAYIVISIGLYGAAITAAVGGASVALERALGWSRQLRLTPLHPVAYVLMKAVVALSSGLLSLLVAYGVGMAQGRAQMPVHTWVLAAAATLLCCLTFAALGLFVGYLVPGENAMQVIGPGLAVLSFVGGVFYPLTAGSTLWHVAVFTPMYGVAEVARSPLTHDLPWFAVVNAVGYLVLFVAGAAWRMSRDTARV